MKKKIGRKITKKSEKNSDSQNYSPEKSLKKVKKKVNHQKFHHFFRKKRWAPIWGRDNKINKLLSNDQILLHPLIIYSILVSLSIK